MLTEHDSSQDCVSTPMTPLFTLLYLSRSLKTSVWVYWVLNGSLASYCNVNAANICAVYICSPGVCPQMAPHFPPQISREQVLPLTTKLPTAKSTPGSGTKEFLPLRIHSGVYLFSRETGEAAILTMLEEQQKLAVEPLMCSLSPLIYQETEFKSEEIVEFCSKVAAWSD